MPTACTSTYVTLYRKLINTKHYTAVVGYDNFQFAIQSVDFIVSCYSTISR